jgi:pantoate--beta-alanine ligase
MAGDLAKAEAVGVDLVFVPDTKTMYTDGFQTTVHVDKVTQPLCGKSRPVHFDGVTTVVAKLFHIVKPHIAVFGQKDYQQLTVVGRMVKDLNMDIQIIGVKTVREPDGLAMSSRNAYLSEEERASALSLKKSLDMAAKMAAEGERDAKKIEKAVRRFIEDHPHTEIDYVTLCHPVSLEETDTLGEETLLALAVRVGKARLIDNALLK